MGISYQWPLRGRGLRLCAIPQAARVGGSKTVWLLYIAIVSDSHLMRRFWLLGRDVGIVAVPLVTCGWLETWA